MIHIEAGIEYGGNRMNRIFISSTCWDLVDVRAELEAEFREQGLAPVLSDSATSDFVPDPMSDSIATCLSNLSTCQCAVFVFDHRYGPLLKRETTGYQDVSATHLEYLEAERLGIPRRVYVRDRLMDDLSNFRATNGERKSLHWVSDKDRDVRLFDVIEGHRKLVKDMSRNWLEVFQNSVHLKQLIRRDFQLSSARARLERQLIEGSLPSIIIEGPINVSGSWSHGQLNDVCVKVYPEERSVYHVEVKWGHTLIVMQGQLAKGQSKEAWIRAKYPSGDTILRSSYATYDGHKVVDEWELRLFDFSRTCSLISRRVTPGVQRFVEIVD